MGPFLNSKASHIFNFLIVCAILSSCSISKKTKVKKNDNIVINDQAIENHKIDAMIQPYKLELDVQMSQELNFADVDLVKGKPESNMGNLITDLSLSVASKHYMPQDSKEIDFCLLNNGGFRTSIPKGPITLGKVFELMPFESELVVLTLSYDSCLALFNYVAINGEPFSNASMLVKKNGDLDIRIAGKELIPGNTYKVLTSDYLARGGDKMIFFGAAINQETVGIKLRDAIIEYFVEEAKNGKSISSQIEGRINYE